VRRRGLAGNAVSLAARSTSASACASMSAAKASRKRASRSVLSGIDRKARAASRPAAHAASTSSAEDTGYASGSRAFVDGSTALKVPEGLVASRHVPAMRTGAGVRKPPRSGQGHAVFERQIPDGDADEIAAAHGKLVRRHDARSGHQKHAIRKRELHAKVVHELFEWSLDL